MSPAKDSTVTGSLADLILAYLAENPGEHRCHEVAREIGRDTQPTANECARLYRRGVVERVRRAARTTGALTITFYAHKDED